MLLDGHLINKGYLTIGKYKTKTMYCMKREGIMRNPTNILDSCGDSILRKCTKLAVCHHL